MSACGTCGFESPGAFRFCPQCGALLAAAKPSHEQRKTVTVLFCDLAGSTELGEKLDPERVRALLGRYFARMQAIVEHHGGVVEKFIGDAVMAVFGVPVVHEDDALRAARAALEMRDALPGLGLAGRIGIMTGEVVTGTEERLATGDAVNVAARLEQASRPGEVLIGQPTLSLIRDAAEVERLEPLILKGKAEPVAAYRLLSVREAQERRHGGRFVGRQAELARIRQAWELARAESRCELVTVVGDAGVGKSRLIAEALASLDATVVRGRCLPYGKGITYWPVVEVLRQMGVRPSDPSAAAAIRSLLGESEAATSADEIAWAFRKTLESAASDKPLAVVFDDIQWGEETFHDLVEHVASRSSGAAILLLCIARPELIDRRPGWSVTVRLGPLGDDDVNDLIPEQIAGDLRNRISRAAGGNPLFIGEIVAMAGDSDGQVVVPPTLQALLAARLDQLDVGERSVLERGSIEGEIFHRGSIQTLAPEDTEVNHRLGALVRKELIRPDRPQLAGEDGYRFRHLLIRDAAYGSLAKAERAELHVRFADWLEVRGTAIGELDEILGYHLEQACRYRDDLGLADDTMVAARARARLMAGGQRAQGRSDFSAAVSLFERAAALLRLDEIDLALELMLIDALWEAGRHNDALVRADSLAERATSAGEQVSALCARVGSGRIRLNLDPEGATEPLVALVKHAIGVFEATENDLALYTGYYVLGWTGMMRARMDEALGAFDRAAVHARRLGRRDATVGMRASVRLWGTTPASEVLMWLDENEPRESTDHRLRASRAWALSMLGRFGEARAILAETRAHLAERGGTAELATAMGLESVFVELLAGDAAAAAELGAEGCRMFEEMGERAILSTAVGMLGQALYALNRLDEADACAGQAVEIGASDDRLTQFLWRQVRAKVLARRGEDAEAERLAREAVAICEATDLLDAQGDVYADLAEVTLLAGKPDEAAAALEQALACYEGKGNLISTARAQGRLAELKNAAPAKRMHA